MVAARIRIRICELRSPGIEGAGLSGSPIASVIQYSSPPALPPSPCLDAPLHDSSSPCRQCRIPPSLLANPISISELGELGELGEHSCSSVAEVVVAMECSVEFTGIGESTITVVGLNPASVTTRRTPRLRRTWVVDGRCVVGDVHMGPSSNSGRVQRSLARHVNDLIRRHCERVPLAWASISGAGGETLWEGQKGTGATRDVTVGDDETQPSGQDDRKRKSVLILMSDTGGGHRASAEAIKATFELEYGDQYKVHVVDLWKEHTPWPFNQVPRTYSFMVKHETLWRFAFYSTAPRLVHQSQMAATNLFVAREVAKGLAQYQPDVIVSVHPLMQHIPLRVLRARGLLDKVPFTTVITDLSTCHPTWFHKLVTACFCPTRDVAQRALKAGLRESQLRVHGLPIRPSFSTFTRPKDELRKELAMDEDLPAVLLVGGGEGMGPVDATARALGKSLYDANSGKAIGQMVVVCGRNKRLVKKLEQTQWNIPVKINGFVTNMSEWMAASDCIITKAGPGTIAEAMIRELPMLLFDFIAGQEVGNVSFVVENGAGAFCDEPKAISRIIAGWFGVKVGELRQMAENCKKLAQPDAVFKIVHDLDDMVRNKHKYLDHLNFKYCGLI